MLDSQNHWIWVMVVKLKSKWQKKPLWGPFTMVLKKQERVMALCWIWFARIGMTSISTNCIWKEKQISSPSQKKSTSSKGHCFPQHPRAECAWDWRVWESLDERFKPASSWNVLVPWFFLFNLKPMYIHMCLCCLQTRILIYSVQF